MKSSHLLAGLSMAACLICPALAHGETAAEAFARGNTLMTKGEFQEALQAFSAAARVERNNQQYMQQFMLVRRVVILRDSLGQERDPRRWQAVAQSLRSFYIGRRLYREALSLDEQIGRAHV